MANIVATLLAFVLVSGLFLVLWIPLTLFEGWVLSVLWGWFITPVFQIASPTYLQCVGIGIVVSMLTYHPRASNKDDKPWTAAGNMFLAPFMFLFCGWLIHHFFM